MTDDDENHRSSTRTRTFLKGRAIFNNRMSTMDCVVRNVSSTGAKLQLAESVTLPEQFELHIPQKDETVRVRLRWRRGDEVGVSFVTPAAEAAPPSDLQGRLRELESENARLRQLIVEMGGSLPVGGLRAASGE